MIIDLNKKNLKYLQYLQSLQSLPNLFRIIKKDFNSPYLDIHFLEQMIQGSEDHSIGIIDDNIIYFWGFNSGISDNTCKKQAPTEFKSFAEKKYHTRGFYNGIYKYSIKNNNWNKIGITPLNLNNRQGSSYITLGNIIYSFGGYSYTPLSDIEINEYKKKNIQLPSKQNIATYFKFFNQK